MEHDSGKVERDFGSRFQHNLRRSGLPDERHEIAVIRQFEKNRRVFLAGIQIIGFPGVDQFLCGLLVLVALFRLIHDLFIIIESKPVHTFKKFVDRLLRGTFKVGVLHAQKKRTFAMTGRQPVEDRGTDVADVDLSGGGRCETCSEIHISYS